MSTTEAVDVPQAGGSPGHTDGGASSVSPVTPGSPKASAKTTKAKGARGAKPKSAGAAKPKTASAHPPYSTMIKKALTDLKDKKGSSKAAILKYVLQHFKVGENIKQVNAHLRIALKRGVSSGTLKQVKGAGASGSFRLGDKAADEGAGPKPKKTKTAASKKTAASSPAKVKAAKPKKAAASPKTKKAPAAGGAKKAAAGGAKKTTKASPAKKKAAAGGAKKKKTAGGARAEPKAKGGQARVGQVARQAAQGAKPGKEAKAAAIAERRAAKKHNTKPAKGTVRKAAAEATSSS